MKKPNLLFIPLFVLAVVLFSWAFIRISINTSVYDDHIYDEAVYDIQVIICLVLAVLITVAMAVSLSKNRIKAVFEPFVILFFVACVQYFPESMGINWMQQNNNDYALLLIPVAISVLVTIGLAGTLYCIIKGLRGYSIAGKMIFRKFSRKSVRGQLLLCVVFAYIVTAVTGAVFCASVRFFLYNGESFSHAATVSAICGPILIALITFGLFMRKSSVGGDIEATVKASLSKVKKAEEDRVELITNMSHDLKTPMTSIIGNLEQLLDSDLPKESRQKVELVVNKCDHLNELINEVFELSGITSGTKEPDMKIIDIHILLNQFLAEYEDDFTQNNLKLVMDARLSDCRVLCDGNYVYRIMKNIFENILKYADSCEPVVLELSEADNDRIRVSVSNKANYEMNFDSDDIVKRFVRGSESRSGEGSGIGLAIAKAYTESCGGEFYVEVKDSLFVANVVLKRELN